jgi:hypothetical protein
MLHRVLPIHQSQSACGKPSRANNAVLVFKLALLDGIGRVDTDYRTMPTITQCEPARSATMRNSSRKKSAFFGGDGPAPLALSQRLTARYDKTGIVCIAIAD